MSWWTLDVRCTKCDHVEDDMIRRSEWDPEANDGKGIEFECKQCGGPAYKTMSLPNVTRASYVDGNDRFDKLKKKSKMKLEMYNRRPEERAEVAKEIKKLDKMDKARN